MTKEIRNGLIYFCALMALMVVIIAVAVKNSGNSEKPLTGASSR